MDERSGEDLSFGGPTGLFSKALRDTGKRISVSSLKGMGLRDDRRVIHAGMIYLSTSVYFCRSALISYLNSQIAFGMR